MDREELLARYRTSFADLQDALDGITDEELDWPQPDGEWTARQIAHHLADSEAMAYTRLRRLIRDDPVAIQGYDEPEWARRLHYERPIAASVAVVEAVRAASLELLLALTPTEWERTGVHSETGAYSVRRWLEIYADHTHDHADQIRRARSATA